MAQKTKQLVKVTDFPQNHENPFLPKAIPEMKGHFTRALVNAAGADQKAVLNAFDPSTGEVLGNTTFVRRKIVDDDKFTKLYLAQFEAFFDLSQAGIRVFGYFMTCMKPSRDMVVFDKEACSALPEVIHICQSGKGLVAACCGEFAADLAVIKI